MIRSILVRWIQKALSAVGLAIVSRGRGDRITMRAALRAAASRHPSLRTIIDVGASDGRWSLQALEVFPHQSYLLIEAQSLHEPDLCRFCRRHPQAAFVLAAAAEHVGEIYFQADEPFGGQASAVRSARHDHLVAATTVDHEVGQRGLKGPFLLKLDTHGFEVPILEGARETLRQTEVLVIECYNFEIAAGSLLFHRMCEYLSDLGFRCIDLVDPMHRPMDSVLWQMDLVFARSDRPEFVHREYR